MKIGFVRLNDSELYEGKQKSTLEPLGLEYVAANLAGNHDVKFWDLNVGDEFVDYENFDCICITVPTPLYNQAKFLIKKIRETSYAIIVVGGPHPSIMPEECISDLGADRVVVGEGESSIDSIISGWSAPKIKKIDPIESLDLLRFPTRISKTKYRLDMGHDDSMVLASMITSRSCPYQCVFCSSKKIFGQKLRTRSVQNIISEMCELKDSGYNTIIFLDDTFTFDRKRTIELCDEMIKLDLGFKWWIDTRVDKVDEELLLKMKSAGCSFIVYGIESGNNEILSRIKKNITTDQVRHAIEITKGSGIGCKANFMLGHLDETERQMMDTVELAREIKATKTSFYQVIPLPGTPLFQYSGISNTKDYDRLKWYGSDVPTICDRSISSSMLKQIQKNAYAAVA